MASRVRERTTLCDSLLYEASAVGEGFPEGSPSSASSIQSRFVFTPSPGYYELREVYGTRSYSGGASSVQESVADTLGCKSRFNPCLHFKRFPVYVAFSPASGQVQPWRQSYTWIKIGQPPGQVHGKVYPSVLESTWTNVSFPAIQWGDLTSAIGDEINGHMEASSNMLVTMAEWSQTVGMLKNPFGLLRRNWRRTGLDKPARSLVKEGANVWLEYRYGWSNLYRDLIAVAKARDDVRRHLDYLRRTDGSWASLAKSQIDVHAPTAGTVISSTGVSPNITKWILNSAKRTCRLSCDVYREKAYERFAEWELLCERLGLDSWIEAAWDVVPFSFVVDWFIDIGGISSWRPEYADQKKIRQAGYSVKTEYTAQVQYETGFSVQDSPTHWTSFSNKWSSSPQVILKKYERSAGFPSTFSPPKFFSGLNVLHATDGIALIAQRIR